MKIEIDLKKISWDFLLILLARRQDLSQERKATVISELAVRNLSAGGPVQAPH